MRKKSIFDLIVYYNRILFLASYAIKIKRKRNIYYINFEEMSFSIKKNQYFHLHNVTSSKQIIFLL